MIPIFDWDCNVDYQCFKAEKDGFPPETPIPESEVTARNWINWAIYVCCVAIITIGAYLAQRNKEPQKIHEYTTAPKVFFICTVVSAVLTFLGLILVYSSQSAQHFFVGTYFKDTPEDL